MDLAQLTPDQLLALKQQLDGLTDSSGRSPIRPRQLTDLRLLPTKDDPRPLFISSAEAPRDGRDLTKTTPYPKLMWHQDTGTEITVYSSAEERQMSDIYTLTAPAHRVLEPMDALKLELDSFSEEDRALILNAQKQTRIAELQAKLAGLSEEALTRLLGESEQDEATGEVKRRPGRPRKTA